MCQQIDVTIARTAVWAEGGAGGTDLAKAVVQLIEEKPANYHRLYTDDLPLADKASLIVREIYGGAEIEFAPKAKAQLQSFKEQGWDQLPMCMAKTQYSFSDDPKRLGAPDDFTVTIREFVPKLGAGFIVALTGAVMTMPGLPKKPAAINMDVTSDGQAIGLF
jgi:formate--tetrahydrofolate ligase